MIGDKSKIGFGVLTKKPLYSPNAIFASEDSLINSGVSKLKVSKGKRSGSYGGGADLRNSISLLSVILDIKVIS